MVNYSQWHTERCTSKTVHAIEKINVLSGKVDELMELFANKSVSSDPNDMPLSTLIDNNNESMVTTRIEGILILGLILVILLIIMEIPTTTLMEILIRCPLNLRVVLKSL